MSSALRRNSASLTILLHPGAKLRIGRCPDVRRIREIDRSRPLRAVRELGLRPPEEGEGILILGDPERATPPHRTDRRCRGACSGCVSHQIANIGPATTRKINRPRAAHMSCRTRRRRSCSIFRDVGLIALGVTSGSSICVVMVASSPGEAWCEIPVSLQLSDRSEVIARGMGGLSEDGETPRIPVGLGTLM